MGELRKELMEVLDVFDYYKIPENKQLDIITSGVLFEFSRNERVRFNCFRFAKLLLLYKSVDPNFDANKMLSDLLYRRDNNYEGLVRFYLERERQEDVKKPKR